MKEQKRD